MPGTITFVVITGLSGAGKSYAIKCFEDMGFFCVDNLPTTLIPTFADLVGRSSHAITRVALGVDVREGEYLTHLLDTLGELRGRGHTVEVLFLEASEQPVVRVRPSVVVPAGAGGQRGRWYPRRAQGALHHARGG